MPTKTVFVLGAGASKRYGYPTGAELKDEIVKGAIDGHTGQIGLHNLLQRTVQAKKQQITDFGHALAGSAQRLFPLEPAVRRRRAFP